MAQLHFIFAKTNRYWKTGQSGMIFTGDASHSENVLWWPFVLFITV